MAQLSRRRLKANTQLQMEEGDLQTSLGLLADSLSIYLPLKSAKKFAVTRQFKQLNARLSERRF